MFVGFANGRSWRTSLSASHPLCPSVNAFERVCVLHYILLPSDLDLFPEDKCFVEARRCLHRCSLLLSDHVKVCRVVIRILPPQGEPFHL